MVPSNHNKNVYYVFPGALIEGKTLDGGWYWIDETEAIGGGPYAEEKKAIEELHKYAEFLNKLE